MPGDWNSQKEKLFYYEGSVWYYKAFDYDLSSGGKRQFIHFGAANYEADVYLNGKKPGKQIGGFTGFNYEITGQLKPKENFVIVKVDNTRGLEKIPTINSDWWNYGGLTRDMSIVEMPATFIRDYLIQLDRGDKNTIPFSVTLNGPDKANQLVLIEIPEANIKTSCNNNSEGEAQKKSQLKTLSFGHPKLLICMM